MNANNSTAGSDHPASALKLDPEFLLGFNDFLSNVPESRPTFDHPLDQVKANSDFFYATSLKNFNGCDDVEHSAHQLPIDGGKTIEMQWFTKQGSTSSAAVIYFHGGGRVACDISMFEPLISYYVHHTGVPMLLVNYHLAPEVTGEQQIQEAWASFEWLRSNANDLGIDHNRIAIMGDSGGGSIAAGLAILARDQQIPLAAQILIYPMLDDTNIIPEKSIEPFSLVTYPDINIIWRAVTGKEPGSNDVSALVAPARLKNFDGLAPAFIGVGYFDPFRKDCLTYVKGLLSAGVAVEFHLYPGVPHGFDLIAPAAQVSKRALADYIRVIKYL